MDLFVINRYEEPEEELVPEDNENYHLQKLKQKIEARRKATLLEPKPDEIILKPTTPSLPPQSLENEDITEELDIEHVKDSEEVIVDAQEKQSKTEEKTAEFKVLGVKDFEKKIKVKRVLPHWLSHPAQVATNLQNSSCTVKSQDWLHKTLKTTLTNAGINHLFPVQEVVIPFILQQHRLPYPIWPQDICVSAPTGSGKTLSFVLPIVQVLMNEMGHNIRALIVLPVQELAMQVAKVFKTFASKVGLKVALLSGATPLRQEQQQIMKYTESYGWVSEVDIAVCTAGRLVEHILNSDGFSLKHLKFLVIDEADRIMDHVQNDWLYHLDRHIKLENELMTGKIPSLSWNSLNQHKQPPHKLLFSATLSQDPEKLEQWGLFQPKLFSASHSNILEDDDDENITKYTTPDELIEQYVSCDAEGKPLVLFHLLFEKKWKRVMCFTNSAQSAHRLTTLLKNWEGSDTKIEELSASLDRTKREAVLKKFQKSAIDVLISTDALARGIDIPNCDYVISYDPPKNIKTYVHRVGRTGRAGRQGIAVTILMPGQMNFFKNIIKEGGKADIPQIQIEEAVFERLSNSYSQAMNATKELIHDEVANKVKNSISVKRGSKNKSNIKKNRKKIGILNKNKS